MSEFLGRKRHEVCVYGTLTPAWRVELSTNQETSTLVPLCHWTPDNPAPPAVSRAWGGLVEYERDCAVCPAFKG